jgi:hypothetical protein
MIATTPDERDDDFYIGYEERMPARIATRVSIAVTAIAIALALTAGVVAIAFERLPPAHFAYGVATTAIGILRHEPYPTLEQNGRRIWLAGRGKLGAQNILRALPEGPVMITGSRVMRGDREMLEVHAATAGSTATLRGEIVDSKCFFGVMNPAQGAVHRDCAVRCLSGGLTPMLLVRATDGREQLVVPVSSDGKPIGRKLSTLAGRAVEVTGQLAHDGSDYRLYADATAYRLLK